MTKIGWAAPWVRIGMEWYMDIIRLCVTAGSLAGSDVASKAVDDNNS